MAIRSDYEIRIKASTDKASFTQAKQSIDNVIRELKNKQVSLISSKQDKAEADRIRRELKDIQQEFQKLEDLYSNSFNSALGGVNLSKFNDGIKQQQINLDLIRKGFRETGNVGSKGFSDVFSNLLSTNRELTHTKTILDSMMETMGNTVKWGISSAVMNTVVGSIEEAYHYSKKLDKSLNEIRVVSGASADEMERFAKEANTAAQKLGTTTVQYTDASLIYYQQGKNDKQIKEMTDITIKLANVLGVSTKEASNYMTAIWNNFAKGGENLEYYADVITKLGAVTASSAEEISEGLSKFSAIADTAGLSYEFASSILATVTAVTRQSADIVGNGLKTILSRIQGLKLGQTLEDGLDLNKYSEALSKVGIEVLDATGELKDADIILSEMGNKWKDLSRAQQLALAQSVAGAHQYNLLVTAMENWDTVLNNVGVSTRSVGTLNEQQNKVLESTESHLKKLTAMKEKLYDAFVDNESLRSGIDGLTGLTDILATLIKIVGGGTPIIATFMGLLIGGGSKSIANSLVNIQKNFMGKDEDLFLMERQRKVSKQLLGDETENLTPNQKMLSSISKESDILTLKQQGTLNELLVDTVQIEERKKIAEADLNEALKEYKYLQKEKQIVPTQLDTFVLNTESLSKNIKVEKGEKSEGAIASTKKKIEEEMDKANILFKDAEVALDKKVENLRKQMQVISSLRISLKKYKQDTPKQYKTRIAEVQKQIALSKNNYSTELKSKVAKEKDKVIESLYEDIIKELKILERMSSEKDPSFRKRYEIVKEKKMQLENTIKESAKTSWKNSGTILGLNEIEKISKRDIEEKSAIGRIAEIRSSYNTRIKSNMSPQSSYKIEALLNGVERDIQDFYLKIGTSSEKSIDTVYKAIDEKLQAADAIISEGVEKKKSKYKEYRKIMSQERNREDPNSTKFIENAEKDIAKSAEALKKTKDEQKAVKNKIEDFALICEEFAVSSAMIGSATSMFKNGFSGLFENGFSDFIMNLTPFLLGGTGFIKIITSGIEKMNEQSSDYVKQLKILQIKEMKRLRAGGAVRDSKKSNKLYKWKEHNGVKTGTYQDLLYMKEQGRLAEQLRYQGGLEIAGLSDKDFKQDLKNRKKAFHKALRDQMNSDPDIKKLREKLLLSTPKEIFIRLSPMLIHIGIAIMDAITRTVKKGTLENLSFIENQIQTATARYQKMIESLGNIKTHLDNYTESEKRLRTLIQTTDDYKELLKSTNKEAEELIKILNLTEGIDYTKSLDSNGKEVIRLNKDQVKEKYEQKEKSAETQEEILKLLQINLKDEERVVDYGNNYVNSNFFAKNSEPVIGGTAGVLYTGAVLAKNVGAITAGLAKIKALGTMGGFIGVALKGIGFALGKIVLPVIGIWAISQGLAKMLKAHLAKEGAKIARDKEAMDNSITTFQKAYVNYAKKENSNFLKEGGHKKVRENIDKWYANPKVFKTEIKNFEKELKEEAKARKKIYIEENKIREKELEKEKNTLSKQKKKEKDPEKRVELQDKINKIDQELESQEKAKKAFDKLKNGEDTFIKTTMQSEELSEEKIRIVQGVYEKYANEKFGEIGLKDDRYQIAFNRLIDEFKNERGEKVRIDDYLSEKVDERGISSLTDLKDIVTLINAEFSKEKEIEYKKLNIFSQEELAKEYARTFGKATEEELRHAIFNKEIGELQNSKGRTLVKVTNPEATKKAIVDKKVPTKIQALDRNSLVQNYLKEGLGYSEEEAKGVIRDKEGNYVNRQGETIVGKDLSDEQIAKMVATAITMKNLFGETYVKGLSDERWKALQTEITELSQGEKGKELKDKYGENIRQYVTGSIAKGEILPFQNLSFKDYKTLMGLNEKEFREMFNLNDPEFIKRVFPKGFDARGAFEQLKLEAEKGYDFDTEKAMIDNSTEKTRNVMEKLSEGKDLTDKELEHVQSLEKEYQSLADIKDRTSKSYIDKLEQINELLEKEKTLAAFENYSEQVGKYLRVLQSNTDGMTLEEFGKELQEILDKDYEISVSIKMDGQSDFDNTVKSMEEIETMAEKIGEDFIVSAKDMEELNDVFPGIVEGFKTLEDGRTQLSKANIEIATQTAKKEVDLERTAAIERLKTQREMLKVKAVNMKQMAEIAKKAMEREISDEEAKNQISEKIVENEAINKKLAEDYKQQYEKKAMDISAKNAELHTNNWITSFEKSLDENAKWAEGILKNEQAVVEGNLNGIAGAKGYNIQKVDAEDFSKGETLDIEGDKDFKGLEALSEKDKEKFWSERYRAYMELYNVYNDWINNYDGKISELEARNGELFKSLDKKSDKKEKDLDKNKIKDEIDIYHDVNIELKLISEKLKLLESQKKKLLGQNKLDNLRKQFSWISKEIDVLNKKMSIAEGESARLRKELSSFGVTFDQNGLVSNYESIYKAQIDNINAITRKFNSLDSEGQKRNQETYEKAKERYEDFKNKLKEYDDTISNIIPGIKSQLEEKANKQIEIQIEGFEMEITVRLDTSEAERQWNDFKTKVLDDIDDKDILGLAKGKLQNYYSYYKDNEKGEIQAATQHVNKILNELNKMDTTGKSDVYGDNRAKAIEDLKKYYDKLKESMTNVHDLADEIRKSYLEAMDKVTEKFQRQVELYETIDSLIEHDKHVIELIYGEDAYDALGKFYDRQEENNNKGLDFHRREVEFWQKEMDTAEKGSEAWEKAKENWLKAVNDWNSAIEKSIENLQDKYINTINSIFQKLNDNVTGSLGLDYVEEEWELINKNADQYLDNVNAIYETQKLQNKYLDAIEKSKNPTTQKKLNELMNKEIEGLREQDKLSKYDIERAELKYQLALKQIALEEAQENKSTLRLRRDSQGNYSYQYVADEDKISDLQQEISDLYNKLYNLDKNAYQDNLNQIFDIWREFQEKMAEAAKINDPEEREARELLLKQQYGELINSLVGENEDIKSNLYQSTFSHLFELYGQDFENYEQMTQAQKDILDQFISDEESARGMAFDNLFGLYNENLENFNTMTEEQKNILMESMVPQWNSAIQQMTDRIVGEGGFEGVYKEAFQRIDGATKDYGNSLKELENQAGVNFDNIKDGTDKIIDRTQDLIQDNKHLINTYREELNAIRGVIAELDRLIEKYKQSYDAARKATEQAHRYWMTEQQKNASINGNVRDPITGGSLGGDSSHSINGGSGGLGGGPGAGTGNGRIEIGDAVRVKNSKADAWYTAFGVEVRPWADQAAAVEKAWNDVFYIRNAKNGRVALAKAPGVPAIAWVDQFNLKGFDTGGYTGEWNSKEGKLALLHQKEMVLNAKDTKNMLDIVKITRDIANNINASVLPNLLSLNAFGNDNIGAIVDRGIEQTVNINANFPEAKDALEIENALNNLINKATQHILKR